MRPRAERPAPANLQRARVRVALERYEADARSAGRMMQQSVELLSTALETFIAAISRESFADGSSGSEPDAMLSITEAAKYLGVGRTTVDEYVRNGIVTVHRLPGATSADRTIMRFSKRDLDAFMASRSVPARSAS